MASTPKHSFHCPRCMLVGVDHDECTPTGTVAWKASRFASEMYPMVQMKCNRCEYPFWCSHPRAVERARAAGYSVVADGRIAPAV